MKHAEVTKLYAEVWTDETRDMEEMKRRSYSEIAHTKKQIRSCTDEMLSETDSDFKSILRDRLKELKERENELTVR